jgi:hypothetical protein
MENIFDIITIKNVNYVNSSELHEKAPIYCGSSRTSRALITEKNINKDDYIFSKQSKITGKWLKANGSNQKLDKVLFKEDFVNEIEEIQNLLSDSNNDTTDEESVEVESVEVESLEESTEESIEVKEIIKVESENSEENIKVEKIENEKEVESEKEPEKEETCRISELEKKIKEIEVEILMAKQNAKLIEKHNEQDKQDIFVMKKDINFLKSEFTSFRNMLMIMFLCHTFRNIDFFYYVKNNKVCASLFFFLSSYLINIGNVDSDININTNDNDLSECNAKNYILIIFFFILCIMYILVAKFSDMAKYIHENDLFVIKSSFSCLN